jgi:hypothetical protein
MAKYDDAVKKILDRTQLDVSGANDMGVARVGGRLGYTQPIDDSSMLAMGLSGHAMKGPGFKDAGLDQADFTYAKRLANDSELRAKLRKNIGNSKGEEYIGAEYEVPFKKGGKVKAKPTTSSASRRGDGCAQRGKTRGKLK